MSHINTIPKKINYCTKKTYNSVTLLIPLFLEGSLISNEKDNIISSILLECFFRKINKIQE